MWAQGLEEGMVKGAGVDEGVKHRERLREREKFIMYNKTKGVMGNNSDIKIRVRWDLYEKCRFENVNDDERNEKRCRTVIVCVEREKLLHGLRETCSDWMKTINKNSD